MKGVVFTEFLAMVEDRFSLATVEEIIDRAQLPSGGVYTSVGTYPVAEMVSLVDQLAHKTGIAVPELLKAFGGHLLTRFVEGYPGFFSSHGSALDFLMAVEGHIHVEVRKLYADAELPRFLCERPSPDRLVLHYRSPRGLADLAEGLIRGCAAHYREPIELEREDLSAGRGQNVRFYIHRVAQNQSEDQSESQGGSAAGQAT